MRLKKLTLVAVLLLTVTPLLAVAGTTNFDSTEVNVNGYSGTVGVQTGSTIKYDINELTLPPIDNVTIGSLVGNQLYVKVTDVEATHEFNSTISGPLVWYSLGLLFTNDVSITIGEGFTAIDLIIPAGAATPAIGLAGVPHFDGTFEPPAFFFLDDDWAEHEAALTFMGLSVTNDATTFSGTFSNSTSELTLEWRKSDGILTAMHVENYAFIPGMENIVIDISLATVEVKSLSLTVGQEILLNAEISQLSIEGSGDYYSLLNQTAIESIETEAASMQDETIIKYVITDVEGLFYTADVFMYDVETSSLVNTGEYLFNGFFGLIQEAGPPPLYDMGIEYMPAYAPVITADWDIYAGYMILMDTIVGVYIDDILDAVVDLESEGITMNTIDGNFALEEKRGYYFMTQSMGIDMAADIVITLTEPAFLSVNVDPTLTISALMEEEAWIGYAEDGVIAGIRMAMNVDVTIGTDVSTVSGIPAGAVTVNMDFKLVNPNYNPPDPIGRGIIPGFTWMIAIPALLGAVALGIIRRRK